LLEHAGIEAVVVEDASKVGMWLWSGPQNNRPQVWIEKADVGRARQLSTELTRPNVDRRRTSLPTARIEAVCEECGMRSLFSGELYATVQNCAHCNAFVDVGDEEPFGDWSVGDYENN
jgi:hypothetical protein